MSPLSLGEFWSCFHRKRFTENSQFLLNQLNNNSALLLPCKTFCSVYCLSGFRSSFQNIWTCTVVIEERKRWLFMMNTEGSITSNYANSCFSKKVLIRASTTLSNTAISGRIKSSSLISRRFNLTGNTSSTCMKRFLFVNKKNRFYVRVPEVWSNVKPKVPWNSTL